MPVAVVVEWKDSFALGCCWWKCWNGEADYPKLRCRSRRLWWGPL